MSFTRTTRRSDYLDARPKTGDKSPENGDILWLFELPWQAAWLRATALMCDFKSDGPGRGSGIEDVLRTIGNPVAHVKDATRSLVFYEDGGVVVAERTLAMLISSPFRLAAFQAGNEHDFFS